MLKTEILYFFLYSSSADQRGSLSGSRRQNVVDSDVSPLPLGGTGCAVWSLTRGSGWEGKFSTVLKTFWFKSRFCWCFGFAGLTSHFEDIATSKKYSEAPSVIKDIFIIIKIEEYLFYHECMQRQCLCPFDTLSTQNKFLLFKEKNFNFHKQEVTISLSIFISYFFTYCFLQEKHGRQFFPPCPQNVTFLP